MELKEIDSLLKSKEGSNKTYCDRYIRFLQKCKDNLQNYGDAHYHHILPRSVWPEFANLNQFNWNSIRLSKRQHFIAHYILARAFPHESKIVFAFNMMRNFFSDDENINSRKYEESLLSVSELFSKTAKKTWKNIKQNPHRLEEFRKSLSKYNKGKITVRYKGSAKHFKIMREDYDENLHEHAAVGRKHSKSTRDKMSKARAGKWRWVTKNRVVKFVLKDELGKFLKDGWKLGYDNPDAHKTKIEIFKKLKWCYNTETGEKARLLEEDVVFPWKIGRPNMSEYNPGWSKASEMIPVVDLNTKKITRVFLENLNKSIHVPSSGCSSKKTKVYLYDGFVFCSMTLLRKHGEKNGIYFESVDPTKFVKKPHYNCLKEINEFRNKYFGKTYSELGLQTISLDEFDYGEFYRDYVPFWD